MNTDGEAGGRAPVVFHFSFVMYERWRYAEIPLHINRCPDLDRHAGESRYPGSVLDFGFQRNNESRLWLTLFFGDIVKPSGMAAAMEGCAMRQKNIATEIREFLAARGIPIVGMAGMDRSPSVPDEFSPQAILGSARTVVCYGVPIPKGILYATNHSLALYWRYCNMVYRDLDISTNRLCLLLEERGHLASPIYGCFPWKIAGREFWGLLPLVYWAEEAGLGKLTRCGLLATPTHGTRMLLGGLITSVALRPSKKLTRILAHLPVWNALMSVQWGPSRRRGKWTIIHASATRAPIRSLPISSGTRRSGRSSRLKPW